LLRNIDTTSIAVEYYQLECLKYISLYCLSLISPDDKLRIKRHTDKWNSLVDNAQSKRFYVPNDIWTLVKKLYW
jgi:hypothetical protein